NYTIYHPLILLAIHFEHLKTEHPNLMANRNKSKKILLLFTMLLIGFLIFLGVMLMTAMKPRHLPSSFTSESEKAKRGSIVSADGFHVATTKKLYKAVVNNRSIDPKKRDLFIQLFSIYSGMEPKQIKKRLRSRKGVVVLSYNVSPKRAQYLKSLAFELRRLGVFVEYTDSRGRTILHGLSVLESGEAREYPYGDLLTPLVGYPRKVEDEGYTKNMGVKGIEKYYSDELSSRQDGKQHAMRDANNYMVLNKRSFTKHVIDGLTVKINIPVTLQIRVERILDRIKKELGAEEIMTVVMEAKSGRVITLASSNRFLPKSIRKKDYPSLNTNVIEYSFEPGSVLKPIIFAMLLEQKKINPYDLVNAHNGRFKLGRKVITDEHKYDWLSAENVIVHSSNIGIAQLAQKLDAVDYHQGLIDVGFTQLSEIDLPYEKRGSIPSISQLRSEIYKATTSYGYGMRANLMQVVKAYNIFNNSGRMISPLVATALIDEFGRETVIDEHEAIQVFSPATAQRMKKILIKTVNEGTGYKAITAGLEVGGKTGTAHIAERGRYVNKYNSSFIGFANDKESRYTIGVTVIKPQSMKHFASISAVPVFKEIVDTMSEEGYLTPADAVEYR
ncbi:MAG: penicillin-binding protein 2, partial [Campylobacterota bacterium]|nr:penicillin-binding protein 2 [Campylobacterota bacterium]